MFGALLAEGELYELLQRFDEDLAAEHRAGGCPRCGGVLHSARYRRKPRGFAGLAPEYGRRLSFCCARAGCRQRATPPSLRFLGRKVYLGAVVVLLMWLYLSAYIVLMGAELNSEMEHQTARDTTRGEEQPMGQRGAQKADTVGESP